MQKENFNHGYSGYARGCRCETCKTESRAYHREWMRKRRAAGLDKWTNDKRKTPLPKELKEKRIITDYDLKCAAISRSRGNENYKLLLLQELEWQKNQPLCEACGDRHPPHKSDHILVEIKDLWVVTPSYSQILAKIKRRHVENQRATG